MYLLNRICKEREKYTKNLHETASFLDLLLSSFYKGSYVLPTAFGINRWNLKKEEIKEALKNNYIEFTQIDIINNQLVVFLPEGTYKASMWRYNNEN